MFITRMFIQDDVVEKRSRPDAAAKSSAVTCINVRKPPFDHCTELLLNIFLPEQQRHPGLQRHEGQFLQLRLISMQQ